MTEKKETAREFAKRKHGDQKRKWTNKPYWNHLQSVADMASVIYPDNTTPSDVAWLHDTLEDTETSIEEITEHFGSCIAHAVEMLSDLNPPSFGNRAKRKLAYCQKVEKAFPWVQTLKVLDMLDNMPSIIEYDPDFAKVFMREKRELLLYLPHAHWFAQEMARGMINAYFGGLK